MRTNCILPLTLTVMLAAPALLCARTPSVLNYQGRIQSGGADFTGAGQFKFAIVHNGAIVWRNAPDANSDGQPDSAVSLAVNAGLFNAGIGDISVTNMAALTLSTPFDTAAAQGFTLRVWFNDGTKGFQVLTPDQTLQSVPFAQVARSVDDGSVTTAKLASGAVTAAILADNSVTSAKLAAGAVTAADLAPGAVTGLGNGVLNAEATGVLDAGFGARTDFTTPVTGRLLLGSLSGPANLSVSSTVLRTGNVISSGTPDFPNITDIAVAGTLVAVTSRDSQTVTFLDYTNPASPALLSTLKDGAGGIASLSIPEAVALGPSGNFAYVVSSFSDSFTIINLSNPAAPVIASVRTDGAGGVNDIGGARDVVVSASFAYVAGYDDDAICIFNVSNRSNPTVAAVIKSGVNGVPVFSRPRALAISGSKLIAATNSGMRFFDVSTPAAPVQTGTSNVSATPLAVSGNHVYAGASTLYTFDLSGAAPVVVSDLNLAEPGAGLAPTLSHHIESLSVLGNELWAVTGSTSRILRYDITDPANPVLANIAVPGSAPASEDTAKYLCDPSAIAAFSAGSAVAGARGTGSLMTVTADTARYPVSMVARGNVGIGVSLPLAPLHVGGTGMFEGNLVAGNCGIDGNASGSLAVGENCVITQGSDAAGTAVIGVGLLSDNNAQLVVGRYNKYFISSTAAFAVGNGSSMNRNNAFTVLENGNVGLNSVSAPVHPIEHSSGARLTAGGTWTNASDRNLKENIAPADPSAVLQKLDSLPVYTWNYKAESAEQPHMGPMAQDFHAAFGLGGDEKSISTVDSAGVTLAAIKALIDENKALRARIEALEKKAAGGPAPQPANP